MAHVHRLEPFGEILRRHRRRVGLTIGELGAVARVSKPYLSSIETGNVPPPLDEICKRIEAALTLKRGTLARRSHVARTPAEVLAIIPPDVLLAYLEGREVGPRVFSAGRRAIGGFL